MKTKATSGQIHVLPINDLAPHDESAACWCRPKQKKKLLWLHNSLDRREHTLEKGIIQ